MSRRYTESQLPEGTYVRVRYDRVNHKWKTTCWLKDKKTNALLAFGSAYCGPHDNPCRRIGRAIAVGRALKNFYSSKACQKILAERLRYDAETLDEPQTALAGP